MSTARDVGACATAGLHGMLVVMFRALLLLVVMFATCFAPATSARELGGWEEASISTDGSDLPWLAWLRFEGEEVEDAEPLEEAEERDGDEARAGSSSRPPALTARDLRQRAWASSGRLCAAMIAMAAGEAEDRRASIRRRRTAAHVPRMDADPAMG